LDDKFPTIPAKSIVFKNESPSAWFGLDYNMNIYRGCSHDCIYCDSRSDCFKNDIFSVVKVKENALHIIRDDLRRKVLRGVVSNGSMSDPYNPLERELMLSRRALELINAYGFGASPLTKSALIARDADILKDIQAHSPVLVKFSITAADDGLSRKLEPNVSVTSERFEALSALADKGIFCGVFIIPVLPFVTDTAENILSIVRMAKEAGARFVYTYLGMTLRRGSREYYYKRLDEMFPGVKEKYVKRFGLRKNFRSDHSNKLWGVFAAECERLGLLYDMKAITYQYKLGYDYSQLTLM